jgi:eukaryotic-like serine/threonine-protein kinase
MDLAAGARLGPYEILSPLGAGGMGEVYRARDPRLGREVAIKVLPSAFSVDPERMQRFEQEAHATAALNHPNILAVHDVGEHAAAPYIVSELLEGETLRERLGGGALPVRRAVEYAVQVAHGLAAAHEKGIAHRDLKPENIFITSDGRVKILDFGLAKLTQGEPALSQMSALPTTPPNTLPGIVLGTIGYMAPEQVRGQPADHRSDIFAFGAVLYEMLSGRRAFHGDTAMDAMMAIAKDDPPDLPSAERHIPPALARIVARCLEKNAAARFQSTRDLAFALETLSTHSDTTVRTLVSSRRAFLSRARPAWSVAGVLAVVAVALTMVALGGSRTAAVPRPVTRLELILPLGVELFTLSGNTVVVSPDGTRVAFIGVLGGVRQIYVRALDGFDAAPVRGTENASLCFFSADGRSIGFIDAGGVLRRVSLADGLVGTIVSNVDFDGAAWGSDDRVVFVRGSALWRVSASGGAPEQLMMLEGRRKEVLQARPTVLPGSNAILFASTASDNGSRIEALVLATRQRRVLVDRGTRPQYVPSGHLIFYRDGELLAAPFDAGTLTVTDSPRRVIENVPASSTGTPVADVSNTGTLVYAPATNTARLVWVSRQGAEQSLVDAPRLYANPRLAPGGSRLLVQAGELWIQDLTRATFTRLTSGEAIIAGGEFPVWVPDGRVVFRSATGLRVLPFDTGRPSEAIAGTSASDYPGSVSADGERLIFVRLSPDTGGDVYVASLRGDPQIHPVLKTPAYEGSARLSPDDRWIAYSSNESGRMEVFIAPFPQVDRKIQVSAEGGTQPVWNPNGQEIFYRSGTKMMSVVVSTSPALKLGAPRLLFDSPYAFGSGITIANYDVSPDGQRFVMVKDESGAGRLNVVLNWSEELNRLVPTTDPPL